ncbi:nucleoside-diphosphate sugar epimerase/dehydratase [uncultured Porphyromonas sp.]|uniref:polysaccharide biosynthesis protein n=1 Tax=uncultured Porphyromonas sp. TaxID=159274 RepID=UPI002594670B|nr:nucleoside-diphosphate sugar epimerase/dehydratase [uncultured Porphyromonas sp.]
MPNKQSLLTLFTRSYLNRWVVLVIDIVSALLCVVLAALSTRYFVGMPDVALRTLIPASLVAAGIGAVVADLLTGVHKQIFRFTTLRVSFNLLLSTLVNAVIALFTLYLINLATLHLDFPPKVVLFYCGSYLVFTFLISLALRGVMVLLARRLLVSTEGPINRKRILVYGVKSNSPGVSSLIESSTIYRMMGFLSNDPKVAGHEINGHRICYAGGRRELYLLKRSKSLDGVLFTDQRDFLGEGEKVVQDCESINLETYLLPAVSATSSDTVALDSVRKVRIEDLLFRETIQQDRSAVRQLYAGKVVMVTGAAGSIGSEIARQIASYGVRRLILFEMAESPLHEIRLELEHDYPDLDLVPMIGDVRNREKVEIVFDRYRPDIVLHAAAYKHVPLMEEHPCESIMANLSGTRNVADMAVRYGAERMVMISTDKAVNPTNVMGACKRACEMYIQSLGQAISEGRIEGKTIFVTTRFGNVLGSNGSVIGLFRRQIASGGPVTVTHKDIVRYFMSIPEACSLVLQASTLAERPQIFVFDMGQAHKIDELARRMIRLSGFEPDKDIKIIYTGLRPGEKLYEEVLATTENTEPTSIDKIRIADIRPNDYAEISEQVERILTAARNFRTDEAVRELKVLIPEFISNNSPYQHIDEELHRSR